MPTEDCCVIKINCDSKQLLEAFANLAASFKSATRSVALWSRVFDLAGEADYRAAFGHKPPGSWRTKRLAKKRRKAIAEALEWPL